MHKNNCSKIEKKAKNRDDRKKVEVRTEKKWIL